MTRLIRRLFLFHSAGGCVRGRLGMRKRRRTQASERPTGNSYGTGDHPGRMVQLGSIIHSRAPGQGCPYRVLDLWVNKL